jgi:ketosteroid isomerase-like protein
LSQESVGLVQAAFRSFEEGDIEGVLRFCDEKVEITQPAELLGVSPHQHGHAGVREAFGIWPEQWDDFRLDVVRVADAGDRVLVATIQHGRGKGSGVEVAMPFSFVFSVRAGKIVEWQIFTREGEAIEAAGLAE